MEKLGWGKVGIGKLARGKVVKGQVEIRNLRIGKVEKLKDILRISTLYIWIL